MAASYKTFNVEFSHVPSGGTRQNNQQTITIWGESEFAAKKELEDRLGFKDVVILEMEER